MSNVVRGCFPFAFRFILSVLGKRFQGPLKEPLNNLLDHIESCGNVTLEIRSKHDGVGEPSTEHPDAYDGCIGRLQRNESDFMMQLIHYPITAVNITQGDIALESSIGFISMYSPRTTQEVSAVSIDSCFSAFSARIWCLCVALALAIHLTILIRRKLKGTTEKADEQDDGFTLYKLITHLTGFGAVGDSGHFMKAIFVTCSIYCFLVLSNYFCSLISTELVTVPPPDIFRTYQDLIDRGVSLTFMSGWNTYLPFKFAPENSIHEKLWRLGEKKYGRNNLLVSAEDATTMISRVRDMVHRKSALALDTIFIPMSLRDQCILALDRTLIKRVELMLGSKLGGKLPFPSIDPDEKRLFNGVIYGSHFRGPLFKRFRDHLVTFRENGLVQKTLHIITEIEGWTATLRNGDDRDDNSFGAIRDCRDAVIQVPEVVLEGVSFDNVTNFTLIYLLVVSALFFVLFCEIMIGARGRHQKKMFNRNGRVGCRTHFSLP